MQTTVILAAGVSLWLFISRWIILQSGGGQFLLTVAWGVLALVVFAAGFLLHERIYRWLGLAILACAVGRVILIDVWKLDKIFRILSFMGLGIVLLIIGFIYNRFQDTIRKWL